MGFASVRNPRAAVDGGCGGVGARYVCTNPTKLVTVDNEGQARYAGLSPDIGADELGTVSVVPQTGKHIVEPRSACEWIQEQC